ncbi:RecQ family ATP-dependent DNA helicase [Granulicella aggregans]|uniref:RecQ family ATP-dependent DNA helicase n=1 Tax=Granulicella aggregans TaxID=474949 RepID=UPI0021DF53F0|nr:RecQ family ATP-dependent DNA helicase [Granulicella aggregans]
MDLERLLHVTFGFPAFRSNQEAVCRSATEGRDVLLVMPTGAGKSLCYQLPAIARGGTALVISPLIALMDDQASKLTAAGLKVARIHSGLDREQSRQACRDYLDGTLQFLFIAPERMRVPGFPEMLAKRKPALIAIDEAHCISAWGHDFRPDYRTLGDYLPSLRPAPIIALTATATPTVQKDIVAQLQLKQPELFIHGFRRDNLHVEVVEMSKPRRNEFTVKLLSKPENRPAIVYAPSRKAADELSGMLGGKAAAYHAGLEASVRERVQRHFQSGKLEVVVATIAFGMGIDKADVRTVVHIALPASVEAYYQEIGRAGRDGKPSKTVLLHSFVDRKIHDGFLERDYPPVTDLARVAKVLTNDFEMPDVLCAKLRMSRDIFAKCVEKLVGQGAAQIDMAGNVRYSPASPEPTAWMTGYARQVEFRQSQIDRMAQFADTQQCRMSALVRHFGDTADGMKPCGHCDFCAPEMATAQSFREPDTGEERHLRAILQALASGQPKATGRLFTDLALGPDRREFDGYLDALSRAGLVSISQDTFTNAEGTVIHYKRATLTGEGREHTGGARTPLHVMLKETEDPSAGSGRAKKGGGSSRSGGVRAGGKAEREEASASYSPEQKAVEARLREWRKAEAAKTGKPSFIVFSDSVLHALVVAQPRSIKSLLTVSGIGPEKADRYGAAIVALMTGAEVPGNFGEPVAAVKAAKSAKVKATSNMFASAREPRAVESRPAEVVVHRKRMAEAEPAESLTAEQQALDHRLREWRKVESERLGLPQFFVLGSSALRSIVLERPRNLGELEKIAGLGREKIDKYGAGILDVCLG